MTNKSVFMYERGVVGVVVNAFFNIFAIKTNVVAFTEDAPNQLVQHSKCKLVARSSLHLALRRNFSALVSVLFFEKKIKILHVGCTRQIAFY